MSWNVGGCPVVALVDECVPVYLVVIVNILLCCLLPTVCVAFAIFLQGSFGGNISNLLPEPLLYMLECSIP